MEINETTYGKLLARALPRVIETKKENERMIAELEELDTRGRPLTPEEDQLAQLMTVLIKQFEAAHYPLGHTSRSKQCVVLMEYRDLRQRDFIPIFGSRSAQSAGLMRGSSPSFSAYP